MSKGKTVRMPSPVFCVQVYDAAKASGESNVTIVALLKSGSVDWTDPASIEPVSKAFREGCMAGLLGVTREAAQAILALKGYSAGAKDAGKRRSATSQAAYRATISRWSYAANMAGMPAKDAGGNLTGRKRAERKASKRAKVVPIALAAVVVPKATTFDDVKSFVRNIAALMRRFENANAKASFGEYRGVIDTFVSQVAALGKAEEKVNEGAAKVA